MAQLHTIAQIQADPALFGQDLAQPGVNAAQGFFLAAEGAQLFPGNPAAMSNYTNWFNAANELNGFGDSGVQSIVTTLKPTDVGAITFNVNVGPGGTPGHVVSDQYATLTNDPGTAAFTWTHTDIVNNQSNAGDEAVATYSQGNGLGSASTWGSVSQATQQPGGTGNIIGTEIDLNKNGAQPGAAVGIDIVAGKNAPTDQTPIIDAGIRLAPGNFDAANAKFAIGLDFAGSAATYGNVIVVPDGTIALSDGHGTGIEIDAGEIKLLVVGHVVADWHL